MTDVLFTNIYTLHDPCGELRYVGKTIHTVEKRLRLHLSNARRFDPKQSYVGNWLRSLMARGFVPEARLLQTVSGDSWAEAEKYWIFHFRTEGCRLVNLAEGGQGTPGCRHSVEQSKAIGDKNRGRKHTAETRALMSVIALQRDPSTRRTGWHHSEEMKVKLSHARQQVDNVNYLIAGVARRTVNPVVIEAEYDRPAEWRNKIKESSIGSHAAQAKLGLQQVIEIKQLLLEGKMSQEKIAQQYSVSRSLIGLIQRNKRWDHVPWPSISVAGTMYADMPDEYEDDWLGF